MTFRSIVAIAISLPLLLTGCSASFLPEDFPATAGPTTESKKNVQETVTADRDAKVDIQRVEITTIPAPVATPTPEPKPIVPPEAPVTEPNVKTTPEPAPPAAAAPAPAPVRAPAPVPAANGHAWIQATMAKYGAYPAADTRFVIGPMPAGCEGSHGCTEYTFYDENPNVTFNHVITLLPGSLTEYLLFHEIAHTHGIRNECEADNYARSILGPVPGFYC